MRRAQAVISLNPNCPLYGQRLGISFVNTLITLQRFLQLHLLPLDFGTFAYAKDRIFSSCEGLLRITRDTARMTNLGQNKTPGSAGGTQGLTFFGNVNRNLLSANRSKFTKDEVSMNDYDSLKHTIWDLNIMWYGCRDTGGRRYAWDAYFFVMTDENCLSVPVKPVGYPFCPGTPQAADGYLC